MIPITPFSISHLSPLVEHDSSGLIKPELSTYLALVLEAIVCVVESGYAA